jgi:hypothetical protein
MLGVGPPEDRLFRRHGYVVLSKRLVCFELLFTRFSER